MTARLLFGKRGSDFGIWVSQPGGDVFTATGADLFYEMGGLVAQRETKHTVTAPIPYGGYVSVAIPDQGFKPLVSWLTEQEVSGNWIEWPYQPTLLYNSDTSLRFYSTAPGTLYDAVSLRTSVWVTNVSAEDAI